MAANETFFITTGARSYSVRGPSGQGYSFSPKDPVKVAHPRDVDMLKRNQKLMEVSSDGELKAPKATPKPVPRSFEKFTPQRRTLERKAN